MSREVSHQNERSHREARHRRRSGHTAGGNGAGAKVKDHLRRHGDDFRAADRDPGNEFVKGRRVAEAVVASRYHDVAERRVLLPSPQQTEDGQGVVGNDALVVSVGG